jgi:K+-transporting ATPase KdpF subunit
MYYMKAVIYMVVSNTSEISTNPGYIAGAVIALLIFGYLLYSLIRPEKF